jgi:hypothetical protein
VAVAKSRVRTLMLLCLSSGKFQREPRLVLLRKLSVVVETRFQSRDPKRIGAKLRRGGRQADLGRVSLGAELHPNGKDLGTSEVSAS